MRTLERDILVGTLLEQLPDHYNPAQREIVERAYRVAEEAHRGQKRQSGKAYITHCLEVASILAEMSAPAEVVAAGLLHDTVEDTKITLQDVRNDFGDTIANLVDGVTKLTNLPRVSRGDQHLNDGNKDDGKTPQPAGLEAKLRSVISDELGEVRSKYAQERRTALMIDDGELDTLDLIEDEEVVVVLSARGFVKTVAADSFRTQGRGGKGVAGTKLRDEDYVEHLLMTTAHSYLLFFSNRGKVYRVKAHEIPEKDRTARGVSRSNSRLSGSSDPSRWSLPVAAESSAAASKSSACA